MIDSILALPDFFVSLGITVDVAVVYGLILVAVYFFVSNRLPVDITAILIMVLLMVLEPWTRISPVEAISGFANLATITVLAMVIFSGGLVKTGVAQMIGHWLARFAGKDEFKQPFATVASGGPISGFVDNTPVVAILVSVTTDLAHKGETSPSKLLIPLSYASMLGGTLTLIGTSTNILASEISGRLLGHPFPMFEFTKLGAVVLLVGGAYLLFLAPRLLLDRVPPFFKITAKSTEAWITSPRWWSTRIPRWSVWLSTRSPVRRSSTPRSFS